jgi:hypothetical protein
VDLADIPFMIIVDASETEFAQNIFYFGSAILMFEVLSPSIVQARCMVQEAAHMLLWTALFPPLLHRCMRDVMFHVHPIFWGDSECVCVERMVCVCGARATMRLAFPCAPIRVCFTDSTVGAQAAHVSMVHDVCEARSNHGPCVWSKDR